MQLNLWRQESSKLLLKRFTATYGSRCKIKEVASKKISKSFIFSLVKLSEEYATFDNNKG